MDWKGMGWNGMEWNGMEWDGMEWDGKNLLKTSIDREFSMQRTASRVELS